MIRATSRSSHSAALIDRSSLRPNRRRSGPAVITEYSATTWVPPRASFYLDPASNLMIEL